jgi:hypothetical protein
MAERSEQIRERPIVIEFWDKAANIIFEICNACNFKEPIWYRLIRLTDNDYSGVTAKNLKKVCDLLKVKY